MLRRPEFYSGLLFYMDFIEKFNAFLTKNCGFKFLYFVINLYFYCRNNKLYEKNPIVIRCGVLCIS